MADKAAQVVSEARKAFSHYQREQNTSAVEDNTFVAGFMAGYLMGYAEALEDDPFGRVVARMLSHNVNAIAVAYEARKYTLSLAPA